MFYGPHYPAALDQFSEALQAYRNARPVKARTQPLNHDAGDRGFPQGAPLGTGWRKSPLLQTAYRPTTSRIRSNPAPEELTSSAHPHGWQ